MWAANMCLSTGVSLITNTILTQCRTLFRGSCQQSTPLMPFDFLFCLSCFCRHWVEHRYVLPHDAILQLRRASYLWARPQDLLPVRFQEVTGWSDKLSLESPAKSCGGGQRSREVRRVGLSFFLLLTVITPKSSLTMS